MKNIIGFETLEAQTPAHETGSVEPEVQAPVRSLVQVRFPDVGRSYSYYNDRFNLKAGDLVFVTGKLAGVCGIVETVNYRFKINLADYQRVIANPVVQLHGTYTPIMDKTVSYDQAAVDPQTFRSWIKPPVSDEDEIEFVMGEGYAFELEHFMEDDDVDHVILQRALDYCRDGRVQYLSVRDGIGTAFVEGSAWYEINFRYENGFVSEMYCECPYSGLCKHNLAVLITLRELVNRIDGDDFVAIGKDFFIRMLSISGQAITVSA